MLTNSKQCEGNKIFNSPKGMGEAVPKVNLSSPVKRSDLVLELKSKDCFVVNSSQ